MNTGIRKLLNMKLFLAVVMTIVLVLSAHSCNNMPVYGDELELEDTAEQSTVQTEAVNTLPAITDEPQPLIIGTPSGIADKEQKNNITKRGVMPLAITYPDSTSAVVTTGNELKTALESDNGITTVYLGNDVTVPNGGITVLAKKNNIVISGKAPGSSAINTLTDYGLDLYTRTNTIHFESAGKTVTVRDIKINGLNYYSSIGISDWVDGTVNYENMTYSGPMAAFNQRGAVTFKDCNITITGSSTYEAAEAASVILYGKVLINRTSTGEGAVFRLYNSAPSLTIAEGADVTCTTRFYFLRRESSNLNVSVNKNSKFHVSAGRNFCYDLQEVSTMTVDKNAELYMYHNDVNDYATFRISRTLTVKEGAVFDVRKYSTRAYPCISLTEGNTKVIIDNPKRVILYNNFDALIHCMWSGASMEISTQVINRWSAIPNADADTISNMPDNIWQNAGLGGLNVTVASFSHASNNSASGTLSTNFVDSGLGSQTLSRNNFQPQNDRMLVMGTHSLTVGELNTASSQITGASLPSAMLSIKEGAQSTSAVADGNGDFAAPASGLPLNQGDTVTVMSHIDYLKCYASTIVQERPKILELLSVPSSLEFQTTQISVSPRIVGRADPNWTIKVSDTRGQGMKWDLYASLTGNSMQAGSLSLDNALVFVDEGGNATPLSTNAIKVFSGITGSSEITDVSWVADRGLLLKLTGGQGVAGVAYVGNIEWTLVEAP